MDFDGEPSHFLDYEVDVNMTPMSLCRAVTYPSWCSIQFDVASYLLIGSYHFSSRDTQDFERNTQQRDRNTVERQLQNKGNRVGKSVRYETYWSCPDLLSESSIAQQQPTMATDDRSVLTFAVGKESIRNTVNSSTVSSPICWSLSEERSELEPASTRNQLLKRPDVVPARTDHSSMLSAAIESFNQLLSGHRCPELDGTVLLREEFRQNQSDVHSSRSGASQLQSIAARQLHHRQSAASHERSNFLGLPDRITVSEREMNMMPPLSF